MLTTGTVPSERLYQLAQKAGVRLQPLAPKFSLRPYPDRPPSREDVAYADNLLAQETARGQVVKPRIRTKKKSEEYNVKITTSALSRLVQENGRPGVAQCLLQIASLDTITDAKIRNDQVKTRGNLIKSAANWENLGLVSLLASAASPEQLIDPMIIGLTRRNVRLIQILFESGADPNSFPESIRSASRAGDTFVLELFLRAPKNISAGLLEECLDRSAAAGDPAITALLLQRHTPKPSTRNALLWAAIQNGRIDIFIIVLYYTMLMPPDTLSGLLPHLIQNTPTETPMTQLMVETLLCSGVTYLVNETKNAILECVRRRMSRIIALFVAYGAPVCVPAIQHAVYSADFELVNLLLPDKKRAPGPASECIIALPPEVGEDIRDRLLRKLLAAGATGAYLEDELVRAVSSKNTALVNELLLNGALPGRRGGEALITAVETEQVAVVQRLLATDLGFGILEEVFLRLGRAKRLPRLLLTKLFLAKGISTCPLSIALRNAVVDYSENRDDRLIEVLVHAGGRCDWNDAESLRSTIDHSDIRTFHNLVQGYRPDVRSSFPILPDTAARLMQYSIKIPDLLIRNDFMKALIDLRAAGAEVADTFCEYITTGNMNSELLDCFIFKSTLDPNYNNGDPIVKAAKFCNEAILRRVLQIPNISTDTISRAANGTITHDFPSDTERAAKISILLQLSNSKKIASQVLKQLIDSYVDSGIVGSDWPLPTLQALLYADADVNVEAGSCLITATSAGAQSVLSLLLSRLPLQENLDRTFQHAVLLTDRKLQYSTCEMLLKTDLSPGVISQALIQAAEQQNPELCSIFLNRGARVDYAGACCMKTSIALDNPELLRLFCSQGPVDQLTLHRLWTDIGPVSSSNNRSVEFCTVLLGAGFAGPDLHATVLNAIKSLDLGLCRMLLSRMQLPLPSISSPPKINRLIRTSSIIQPSFVGEVGGEISPLDEALLEAVAIGEEDICRSLLSLGASPRFRRGASIRTAVSKGSTAILEILLDVLSEPEARLAIDLGIYLAASANLSLVCKFLLARRVSSSDFDDEEIMKLVTNKGDVHLLQIFLDAKPSQACLDVAFKAAQNVEKAVRYEFWKAILDAGLKSASLDAYLLSTIENGGTSEELVKLLLEYGASVDYNHSRPILLAARIGSLQLLNLLLEHTKAENLIGQCFLEAVGSDGIDDNTVEKVRFLLEKKVSLSSVTQALIRIQSSKIDDYRISLTKLLLANGADINHCGGQALCYACSSGNPTLICIMLNGNPSQASKASAFAYLFQAKVSDVKLVECMKALLSGGAPAYSSSTDFGRPLLEVLLLSRPESPDLLSRLLNSGYPLTTTLKKYSIIHWALTEKDTLISDACIRVLITHIGMVDNVDKITGQASVHLAVENHRHGVIDSLVKYGAKVNAVSPSGETPLMVASRQGSVELVRSLIKAGAGPDENRGSLHEAARELQPEVAKILIKAGHNRQHESARHGGRSALHELCLHASTKSPSRAWTKTFSMINILVQSREDLLLRFKGKVPLFLALDNSSPKYIVRGLLRVVLGRSMTRQWWYEHDGFRYSLTSYLNSDLCRCPVHERPHLVKFLKSLGFDDGFYALSGPQPPNAVNVPAEILAAENARLLRESRLDRDCDLCIERPSKVEDVFGPLTKACTHEWNNIVCRSCLQKYIADRTAPQSGRVLDSISCWACSAVLEHHEVQKYASRATFEKYDEALMRQAIHKGQKFVECAHKRCKGGGWCEPKTVSYVACEVCQRNTCVACNTPWHRGRVCPNSEEGKRIRQSAAEAKKRKEEEVASEAEVKRISKKCPTAGCGANIQKKSGCDHMTCSQCRGEFCYVCIAPYGEIRLHGNKWHKPTCNYYA